MAWGGVGVEGWPDLLIIEVSLYFPSFVFRLRHMVQFLATYTEIGRYLTAAPRQTLTAPGLDIKKSKENANEIKISAPQPLYHSNP